MSSLQNQISGTHYKRCKIQPVEFIHANAIPHLEACVIRYVVRHRHKNKADDLRKAKHYIEILLELEYGEKGDPAHQPAPESEVETVSDDMGSVWAKCGHHKCDLHVVRPGKSQCSCDDGMGGGLDEVCQDWHGAVREMRTGVPNSAMSAVIASPMSPKSVSGTSPESPENKAVIAPTPSTPGWMDKAAEVLVEKRIDSDEEIYQWGGGRWCVMGGRVFCWNARECEWNESTMLPEQLRADGTRTN